MKDPAHELDILTELVNTFRPVLAKNGITELDLIKHIWPKLTENEKDEFFAWNLDQAAASGTFIDTPKLPALPDMAGKMASGLKICPLCSYAGVVKFCPKDGSELEPF